MASKPRPRVRADTVPPQNLEAEASLIGAMLFDSEAPGRALALLEPTDFYHEHHKIVFEAIGRLVSQGKPADNITVASELERVDKLSTIGGTSGLNQFGEQVATAAHIEYHAQIIRECAEYRTLMQVCMRGYDRSLHRAVEVEELIFEVFDGLTRVKRSDGRTGLVPLSQCLDGDVARIEAWQSGASKPRRIAFGFQKLDELSGGMVPGEVTLIGARPGVGKTSFALQVASSAALLAQRVAIFSVEMSALELRLRLLSQLTGIHERRMRCKAGLYENELPRIYEARERLKAVHLTICDQSELTVTKLRLELQKRYVFEPPDLVVVDYLQIMRPEKQIDNRNNEVARISAGLKAIAKDFDCAVLALSQLNRQNADGQPRLQDLRDSGALEQDAALVLGLHRPSRSGAELSEEAAILVLKNRYEGLGRVQLRFSGPRFTFEER